MAVGRGPLLGALVLVLAIAAWIAWSGPGGAVELVIEQPEPAAEPAEQLAPATVTVMHREPIAPAQVPDSLAVAEIPWDGPLPGEETTADQLDAWTRDLLDDGIKGNAAKAITHLYAAGDRADPWLHRALLSADRQQRQLAAHVLRARSAAPTLALLEESIDMLRRDREDALQQATAASGTADATRYLASRARAAVPALRRGLGSDDPQQRFLCAFLLACGGHVGDAAAMQRELVEHLADNTIGGDAIMAAHALYRMGPGVLPALGAARPYLDAQALQLVDLIEQNLRAPAPRSARGRARLPAITTVYADPVLSFDIRRSPVPKW